MDRKVQEPVKLFQYNTLGALMAGLYGGTMTVGELLEHGDLGLGTLDSIDGELIVLDGKAYQVLTIHNISRALTRPVFLCMVTSNLS